MKRNPPKEGERHGRLTLTGNRQQVRGRYKYECRCKCGTLKYYYLHTLRAKDPAKRTRSCGCLKREVIRKINTETPRKK